MTRDEIVKVLRDSVKDIPDTIDFWIAGGAIRSLIIDGKASGDVDLFFPNQESQVDAANALEIAGWTTIRIGALVRASNGTAQIDLIGSNFHPNPIETLKDFDFTVCCGAFYPREDRFIFTEGFVRDNELRVIVLNNLNPAFGLNSKRVEKYGQKGYTISAIAALEFKYAAAKQPLIASGY